MAESTTTYVITGANRGIGLAYVKQLAPTASNIVVALVRNPQSATALHDLSSSHKNIHIVECDTSSPESIAKLSTTVPAALQKAQQTQIDYLINNAGILKDGGLRTTFSEDSSSTSTSTNTSGITAPLLTSHMLTNVLGPAHVTATLLPHLSPTAVVANISSGLGSLALLADATIPPHNPVYSMSKAALNMLTVHQAYELKQKEKTAKIVVVCVDPGHVRTDMGGPNGAIDAETSVRGILGTLEKVKGKDESGVFLQYDGSSVKW